jgi:AraC family transcriptional regulator, transcriptional activator of pobA
MTTKSIKDFYKDISGGTICAELEHFLDTQGKNDIGHFNVFSVADLYKNAECGKIKMPYSRRTYYKISLINGRNRAAWADKEVQVEKYALLFASPKIPYHYQPLDTNQQGQFCVFTKDFLPPNKTGFKIDELPIFSRQSDFIYEISEAQYKYIEAIFTRINTEIKSDYAYKYDLLRNYVVELIHYGQKLKPAQATGNLPHNAASRISSLFVELLERQFPIETPTQAVQLRTAKEFADTLRVHVNHLNKVLKETMGKTTTEIITARLTQEAKMMLRQTDWNVSEIAYSLGFEEVAHFSNFFKKQTESSPLAFRV